MKESISQAEVDAGPDHNQAQVRFARHERAMPDAGSHAGYPHILVVGAEPSHCGLVADYLGKNDLRVTTAANGTAMRALLDREGVDLVLFDLDVREEDGMDLARRLRDASAIPMVILGCRSDEADRVMALELGADDYVTKPFSQRELLARVRAILRRRALDRRKGRVDGVRAYRFGGWELNVNTRQLLSWDARRLTLSNKEFSLLVALLRAGQRVLARAQLIELSRLYDDEVYDRTVDVQIMRLRRKLGEHSRKSHYIATVRGAGYHIGVPVQAVY